MTREILHRDDAAIDLGLAEEKAQPGAGAVRTAHHALQRSAARIDFDGNAAGPKLACEEQCFIQTTRAHGSDEARALSRGRRFRHREQHAVEAYGKSNCRNVGAAELADHPVVPAATDERILSAELARGRLDLEQRSRVVVEPPHELRLGAIRYAERVQMTAEPIPVRAIVGLQQIEDRRRPGDDLLVPRALRVEDSEGIVRQSLLRRFAELLLERHEILADDVAIASARAGAAERIHEDFRALYPEIEEQSVKHRDHFRVGRRPRVTEDLAARLEELAVAPALWPLRAEHRSDVEPAGDGLAGVNGVLDVRA